MLNYIKLGFRDFKQWIRLVKIRENESIVRVLFLHLPQKIFYRLYSFFPYYINRNIYSKIFNFPNFKIFQDNNKEKLGNHFYIIVMPNILQFLVPCIKLLPTNINVLLILNGATNSEEKYLRDNYPTYPIFKLKNFINSTLSHGDVLNLLLLNNQSNFGIIDHDLYIFNKDIFNNLTFKQNEFVIGAFKVTNKKAKLTFPTTHFLFFNVNLVKGIMSKYKIGAQVYRRIPLHVKHKLRSLNLGYSNFLKEYLNFFDTFNLIIAMAFYEKLTAKFIDSTSFDDLYHIGATSGGDYGLYLAYINLKLMELPENYQLKELYSDRFAKYENSEDIKKLLPKNAPTSEFFREIDNFIERLEQHRHN